MHLVEAAGEAAWCHGCLLYPRLICSCWLFSSTEQHDIIHFHIQTKLEHFKAMFTFFVCLFLKKELFFFFSHHRDLQIILCMLSVCM